jgi:hypothetical protein
MNFEMKNNLSQIFRQPESQLNLVRSAKGRLSHSCGSFSLRASVNPFVVDNKFALQLDEII